MDLMKLKSQNSNVRAMGDGKQEFHEILKVQIEECGKLKK